MDLNDKISKLISDRLSKDSPTGAFQVEARTGFTQYDIDQKSTSRLVLIVKNPLIEEEPEKAKARISNVLTGLEALKPHIKFETEANHMERLSNSLAWMLAQEAALNEKTTGARITTIPNKYPEWFKELPKRQNWNIKHALNTTVADTGVINIRIDTPKDVAPEMIVKNFESRKAAIMDMLADRVVKYTPGLDTQEKKDAVKAQVKRLEVTFASQSSGDDKSVYIYIMSPEQLAATKLPGGISADKIKELSPTNPLLALQNGEDDQDPDKKKPQPHLKKALARSFLFAGENHIEIFPYIAGKEDMRRAVLKSLVSLKKRAAENPTLVDPTLGKRVDEFLSDPVFKDQSQWGKPVEKQQSLPESVRFVKSTSGDNGQPYEKGVMEVSIDLPPEKFQKIREDIAATPSEEQKADQAELIKLAEALIAAGNALTGMTKNVIPAGTSWSKKEEIRDASAPNLTLGA